MTTRVLKLLMVVLVIFPLNEPAAQRLIDRLKAKKSEPAQQNTQVVVPNVEGMSQSDAENALNKAGLKLGKVIERQTSYPNGQVLKQQPAADSKVAQGSMISLVVSKNDGAAPPTTMKKTTPSGGTGQKDTSQPFQQTVVPNVVGMNRSDAENTILNAGLKVGNIVERQTNYPNGQVLKQQPAADTKVAPGSMVGFAVSKNDAAAQIPAPSITPPSGAAKQTITTGVTLKSEWFSGQAKTVAPSIRATGLTVQPKMVASDQPRGTILSLSTANRKLSPGEVVPKEEPIIIEISSGLADKPPVGDLQHAEEPQQPGGLMPAVQIIKTGTLTMTGMRVQSQTITTNPLQMTGMRVQSQTITTNPLQMTGMRIPSQTITTNPLQMTGMR